MLLYCRISSIHSSYRSLEWTKKFTQKQNEMIKPNETEPSGSNLWMWLESTEWIVIIIPTTLINSFKGSLFFNRMPERIFKLTYTETPNACPTGYKLVLIKQKDCIS